MYGAVVAVCAERGGFGVGDVAEVVCDPVV